MRRITNLKLLLSDLQRLEYSCDPNPDLNFRMFQGDSDRLKKLKEKSFDYQMRMVEEEPWLECEYQQAKTAGWDAACQKLFCNKPEPVKTLNSSAQQYLCDLKDPHG